MNESDDVNPVVQCKFCPWKSGAGATRIRKHILGTGPAAKCTGGSDEYKAMKSQLLEKESSTPRRDPVEASVKKACLAALQTENAQLKEENARLAAALEATANAEEAAAERRRLADEYLDVALYLYDQLCGRLHAALEQAPAG